MAGARRCARGQAARRRLGEDLHDAGFRRRRVQRLQARWHAREQPVADGGRGDGDHRRSASARVEGRLSHLRGRGQLSCLKADVDAPNHLTDLDDVSLKLLVEKKLPFELTVDDLVALEPADLKRTGGRNSRLKMAEQAFKRAYAAGVPFVFGSGATSAEIPHGKQAGQFAYFIKWGMERVDALKMPFLPTARMLNYNWVDQIGSLEKGKYADIIAVAGNPLADISEMQRVRFVMKGGYVVKNDLGAR